MVTKAAAEIATKTCPTKACGRTFPVEEYRGQVCCPACVRFGPEAGRPGAGSLLELHTATAFRKLCDESGVPDPETMPDERLVAMPPDGEGVVEIRQQCQRKRKGEARAFRAELLEHASATGALPTPEAARPREFHVVEGDSIQQAAKHKRELDTILGEKRRKRAELVGKIAAELEADPAKVLPLLKTHGEALISEALKALKETGEKVAPDPKAPDPKALEGTGEKGSPDPKGASGAGNG